MGYAQLDNGFWLNDKVDSVSDKAFRLYVRSISFASANITDGFISEKALRMLGGTTKLAQELLNARGGNTAFGLWESAEGGWVIHDYAKHNRTKADRDAASTKAKNAASIRWGDASSNATSIPPSNAPGIAVSNANGNAKEKNREEKNREERPQASLTLVAEDTPDSVLPVRIRELRDTVLQVIPLSKREDSATRAEAELLARDFVDNPTAVTNAINAAMRDKRACWPGVLREYINPPKPKNPLAVGFFPPEMGPEWMKEVAQK